MIKATRPRLVVDNDHPKQESDSWHQLFREAFKKAMQKKVDVGGLLHWQDIRAELDDRELMKHMGTFIQYGIEQQCKLKCRQGRIFAKITREDDEPMDRREVKMIHRLLRILKNTRDTIHTGDGYRSTLHSSRKDFAAAMKWLRKHASETNARADNLADLRAFAEQNLEWEDGYFIDALRNQGYKINLDDE